MRFYGTGDVNCYVDVKPGWDRICRYPSSKSWAARRYQRKHYINYYRDLEGKSLPYISDEDLYFTDRPKSRIIKKACLPLLYCTGCRFIKLEQGLPAGFTCAPFPMNLIEARDMKRQIQYEKKLKRKSKKKGKKGQKGQKAQGKAK